MLMKYLVPLMEKKSYGKIVFITSQAAEIFPLGWLHYSTVKAALNGFAKALAMELANKNIRVNLVSPGMTETDLISVIPHKAKLLIAAKTPLKRLALPEDVANAVYFLMSQDSDYLTGETIRVNGGQNLI